MVDVSPEQAALFFHMVEVNSNQTTTIVGYLQNTAKVHAIDSKPKAKRRAKAAASPEGARATTAPSTPIKSEGPALPRAPAQTPTPKENPGKGKGRGDPESLEKIAANKKGQQCIRFFRGNCTRGDDCQYGHTMGTDGKPLKIAPKLLARFDKLRLPKEKRRRRVRSRRRCFS